MRFRQKLIKIALRLFGSEEYFKWAKLRILERLYLPLTKSGGFYFGVMIIILHNTQQDDFFCSEATQRSTCSVERWWCICIKEKIIF